MLSVTLGPQPVNVPGIAGLSAMNIDPEAAAAEYRTRVIDQMGPDASVTDKSKVREQLSGACTTEIAAFDAFVDLLADDMAEYDRIIFDTAPTGHTLRLLSLPKAWSGFLEGNDRGASCLGPHSGLKMQESRFKAAFSSLTDGTKTTIVLVSRAERGSIREAERTAQELFKLGMNNQLLAINGRFTALDRNDATALALETEQSLTLATLPPALAGLPRLDCPLLAFDMVGLEALRALFGTGQTNRPRQGPTDAVGSVPIPKLASMVEDLSLQQTGLVMVMGKGGVGKTTVAAAIAIGLARRGHSVHLTTTDPAAHLSFVVDGSMPNLTIDRIDPLAETKAYIAKIMASRGKTMNGSERALLLEDLQSPCTEEVAVFHAFSRIVAEARSNFVVIDTAPTGHTLLLLDATGAYHRQMAQQLSPASPGRITTPLMRLQDPDYTRIILVTLPERTPVSEAASLQEDLRRADIEPYAWVINKTLSSTGSTDPLLMSRMVGEQVQIDRVRTTCAKRAYIIPYLATPPIGVTALSSLT